jgi:lipopolysaccharide heptosyltransferase I
MWKFPAHAETPDADSSSHGHPRLLITRLSAVGDCIHTLPVLCALRAHFPRAFIAWATQGSAATLISGHDALDEVLIVPRDWCRQPRAIGRWRQLLRQRRFDITVDVQGLTKSSGLAWLSGARFRIGFQRGQARELSPWLNNRLVRPRHDHVVRRYLELLEPLGIRRPSVAFRVPVSSADGNWAASQIATAGIRGEFVILNPGAGWDSKLWPCDHYATVARYLWRRHQMTSLVTWAGPRELDWAQRIVRLSGSAAVLAADSTLPRLAALTQRARLFVGSDTGPLHLAAALSVPCVGLFGPTRPEECGPFGWGHRAVQAFHQSGSGRQRRGSDNRAMRAIAPTSVCQAASQLLRKPRAVGQDVA